MSAKAAFVAVIVIMAILRISIGVLLLTAQAEMTTLGLRLIFVFGGLSFIAYAILRAIKVFLAIDRISGNK
jgi:hypothetical protein